MGDVVVAMGFPAQVPEPPEASLATAAAADAAACMHLRPLKPPSLSDPSQVLHLTGSFSELLYLAAIAGTGIVGLAACWHASSKSDLPLVHLHPSVPALRILSRVTALDRPYQPRPFCSHGHVETLAAVLLRPRPNIALHRTCHPLADGGCISLDWLLEPPAARSALPPDAPLALLLPGRMAGSRDAGLQHAALLLQAHGFRAVAFNPRGAAGSPLTSPALPTLAPTADLAAAVHHAAAAFPDAPLVAVGWSAGANLLIRYLGEAAATSPITAAVALSTPFDLPACLTALHAGLNHHLYGRHAVAAMQAVLRASALLWTATPADTAAALRAATLPAFDAALGAAPAAAAATYSRLSCRDALRTVAVPLLLLAALDDPLVPPATLPLDAVGANPACVLVTTSGGGHMGWLGGAPSLLSYTWSDEVAVEFLQSALVEAANAKLRRALGAPAAPPSLHDARWLAVPCAAVGVAAPAAGPPADLPLPGPVPPYQPATPPHPPSSPAPPPSTPSGAAAGSPPSPPPPLVAALPTAWLPGPGALLHATGCGPVPPLLPPRALALSPGTGQLFWGEALGSRVVAQQPALRGQPSTSAALATPAPAAGSSPTRQVDDALSQWDLVYSSTRMAVMPLHAPPALPPAVVAPPAPPRPPSWLPPAAGGTGAGPFSGSGTGAPTRQGDQA